MAVKQVLEEIRIIYRQYLREKGRRIRAEARADELQVHLEFVSRASEQGEICPHCGARQYQRLCEQCHQPFIRGT